MYKVVFPYTAAFNSVLYNVGLVLRLQSWWRETDFYSFSFTNITRIEE